MMSRALLNMRRSIYCPFSETITDPAAVPTVKWDSFFIQPTSIDPAEEISLGVSELEGSDELVYPSSDERDSASVGEESQVSAVLAV